MVLEPFASVRGCGGGDAPRWRQPPRRPCGCCGADGDSLACLACVWAGCWGWSPGARCGGSGRAAVGGMGRRGRGPSRCWAIRPTGSYYFLGGGSSVPVDRVRGRDGGPGPGAGLPPPSGGWRGRGRGGGRGPGGGGPEVPDPGAGPPRAAVPRCWGWWWRWRGGGRVRRGPVALAVVAGAHRVRGAGHVTRGDRAVERHRTVERRMPVAAAERAWRPRGGCVTTPRRVTSWRPRGTAGPSGKRCDSRHFWVSGYSERRVLVEGWAYARQHAVAEQACGHRRSWPWRSRTRQAGGERRVFRQPSAENIAQLVHEYGVKWASR